MCNELLELHSVLRLYCANYSNLHWNSCGEEFNDTHVNITDGLIDLFHKWVDPVGEMLTRLGINPLNYAEVLDFIKNASNQYFIADSQKFYTRKDVIQLSDAMLGDTVKLICSCLDSECLKATINAGIKSELESMLNDFDLQYRYLNKRKLCCDNTANINTPCPAPTEAPHEEEETVPVPTNEEDDIPMGDPDENVQQEVCPTCGKAPCECGGNMSTGTDDSVVW